MLLVFYAVAATKFRAYQKTYGPVRCHSIEYNLVDLRASLSKTPLACTAARIWIGNCVPCLLVPVLLVDLTRRG